MSTDSRFVHKIWQENELSKMVEGGFPFPMLADGGGKIGTVYGVYDAAAGVNVRGRFIIDPDGIIRALNGYPMTTGRSVEEILRLVAQGLTNREIADRLCLAQGTVKNYVTIILQKLGARDRTQAALRARELGML
mgnify:CR=1 FL=1